MTDTDDEIVVRIVGMIRDTLINLRDDAYSMSIEATSIMDVSEAYRLAFVDDVRERAAIRRQAKRVRALVFARLGVHDWRVVEK